MAGRPFDYISTSPENTFNLGQRLSCALKPPAVIALDGALGSGKTLLVKGIAAGLGITETITSPTFTIINEYYGSCSFYHVDAYRLRNHEEFEEIGGRDIINSNGITIIEWSERLDNYLPIETIKIKIEITGNNERLIFINGINSI
jgi:tRNA threonylcarbamoyladenosine biosynthesis protein TsaE